MHRVAVFMGTRPEAIKMAPVIEALRNSDTLQPVVVSTGQHREMLAQVVELFGIEVHHDLDVMQPNQTLASLSARLMTRIDELLQEVQPDLVLVQGDTTTVLIASLASFYRRIPVGHVEAGLRTGNIDSPFPEEANRKLATPLVTLHFPPTALSRDNLLAENIDPARVFVTGNTVIDALQLEASRQEDPAIRAQIDEVFAQELGAGWRDKPMVLITGHRRENFGAGFEQVCEAIAALADRYPGHQFVYPVHLNPNVQKPVYDTLGGRDNIHLLPPKDYRLFVALMKQCDIVLTDSGGVQEEAPGLGKPVLVMRDTTERPEGVHAGTVKLVGTDRDSIIGHVSELIDDEQAYSKMAEAVNPYGDGQASVRIREAIEAYFASASA